MTIMAIISDLEVNFYFAHIYYQYSINFELPFNYFPTIKFNYFFKENVWKIESTGGIWVIVNFKVYYYKFYVNFRLIL